MKGDKKAVYTGTKTAFCKHKEEEEEDIPKAQASAINKKVYVIGHKASENVRVSVVTRH